MMKYIRDEKTERESEKNMSEGEREIIYKQHTISLLDVFWRNYIEIDICVFSAKHAPFTKKMPLKAETKSYTKNSGHTQWTQQQFSQSKQMAKVNRKLIEYQFSNFHQYFNKLNDFNINCEKMLKHKLGFVGSVLHLRLAKWFLFWWIP